MDQHERFEALKAVFSAAIMLAVMVLLILGIMASLSSCTYSVNLIHSEGQATDLVDENQSAQPNISPNIDVSPI